MYEYEVENIVTGDKFFIWGYSWEDALGRRPKLNPAELKCVYSEYVD